MDEILIGNKGRIDFATPISMTEEQKNKFFDLLNELYDVVELDYVLNFRNDRLGSKEITARWTAKEYRTLLQIDDYETVAKKLGRTEMSIIMRAGSVIPRLILWCEEKGVPVGSITLEHIETFLKEIEDRKIERRKQRKLKTEIAKKIEKIIDDKTEPCMVKDSLFYGGECKNGFHDGCRVCPRSKGFIKTQEDIDNFNKIYSQEFVEE
tara:strand:+ start:479 stop:1105 length:627 start_codon:yes stop_codon:yes gene_type:complete